MPAEADDSSARPKRADDVIASYLEAVDAGQTPDRAEFLAQHNDIADELSAFFANWDRFERISQPIEAAAGIPKPQLKRVTLAAPGGRGELANGDPSGIRESGDYEILDEIARGGMGVVYRARQISLNRIVALKMILAGQFASPEDVQRFYGEAEAAANLDHPGIVPIYEVGEREGRHFFSMGYVDGPSLAERLREGPLPSQPAAALLKQVCEAVQHAHDHGVIHRDLKPARSTD